MVVFKVRHSKGNDTKQGDFMTSQFSGIDNLLDWDPKMRLKPLDNLNQVTSMR